MKERWTIVESERQTRNLKTTKGKGHVSFKRAIRSLVTFQKKLWKQEDMNDISQLNGREKKPANLTFFDLRKIYFKNADNLKIFSKGSLKKQAKTIKQQQN